MLIGRRLALLVAALALAGCGGTVPSALPAPAGPLVAVETRGGECPRGACGQTIVVERDGRVHAIDPEPVDLGLVPPEALAAVVTEIDQADFEALASTPFTGECPTAFDGQETIFTFATAAGPVRLASCEVVVDLQAPLFVAAMHAIESAGS
jgi:hypothetical protein